MLVLVAIFGSFILSHLHQRLPLGRQEPLPVIATIPEFVLTNQVGQAVTSADLRGQVWLADILFTRCPGPCEQMTRQMAELQYWLPPGQPVKLVSLTTDPEFDSPPVLNRYAERFGAQARRWWFLTGAKAELFRVAVEGLKLTTVEKKPEEREGPADLFVHSTIFVVVDKQGRLRGAFETREEEFDEADQPLREADRAANWTRTRRRILKAVEQLGREKQP